MRENIGLFKAKRKDNGEWVEGYYLFIKEQNKHYILTGKTRSYPIDLAHPHLTSKGFEWLEIDQETLCECTGLKDKNGKLIFEGDIVKYKNNYYNDLTAIVEQKEARYGIWDKTPENKVNDKYCFIFNCICMYLGQYEVIGNIFNGGNCDS